MSATISFKLWGETSNCKRNDFVWLIERWIKSLFILLKDRTKGKTVQKVKASAFI